MSYTIYKLNYLGEEELDYVGEVVSRGDDYVCIRAIFQLKTRDYGYAVLKNGDVFTEWFYSNRWYNIFKIEDVDTKQLKGYYCNLTRPAIIAEDNVRAEDLALDLFVKPSGEILRLDDDEYEELDLPDSDRQQVENAVAQIREMVKRGQTPFEDLKPSN